MRAKRIDVEYVLNNFRVIDGGMERFNHMLQKWTPVPQTPAKDGYCPVSVGGAACGVPKGSYQYHRLLWVLVHKEDIAEGMQIDHINGIRSDNRIENLRLSTKRENDQNKQVHRQGHLNGTFYIPATKTYGAQIQINKHRVNLGRFPTEELAQEAYFSACQHIELYTGDTVQFRVYIRNTVGCTKDDSKKFIRRTGNKYRAYIYVGRTQVCLGGYSQLKEAQIVRDFALKAIDKYQTRDQFRAMVMEWYSERLTALE